MISSKGIKILCKVIMGIVYFLGICSIIASINLLIDEKFIGILYFALGILLPLITTVSLYPIFALANIDENVQSLRDNIDLLIDIQINEDEEKDEQQEREYQPPKKNNSPVQKLLEERTELNGYDDKPIKNDAHSVVRKSREENETISPIDIVGIPNVDEAIEALQKLYQKGFIGEPKHKTWETYDRDGVLMWHCECHISGQDDFYGGDFYSKDYGKEVTAYQMLLFVLGMDEDEGN